MWYRSTNVVLSRALDPVQVVQDVRRLPQLKHGLVVRRERIQKYLTILVAGLTLKHSPKSIMSRRMARKSIIPISRSKNHFHVATSLYYPHFHRIASHHSTASHRFCRTTSFLPHHLLVLFAAPAGTPAPCLRSCSTARSSTDL